jgi:hypothetical protein
MGRVGLVARMEEKRNACRLLVGKPEGMRPLGRPQCRRMDNIRIDPGGIRMQERGIDWTGLTVRSLIIFRIL